LIERRCHSSGEQSLTGTVCGIDGHAVAKEIMEILSGYKGKTQNFDMNRFDLKRPTIYWLRNSSRFISEEGLQI
jgi:hypothetical protein